MSTITYRIMLNEEPEGGYTASVPSLPGCITYGDNLNEALEMAKEAIEAIKLNEARLERQFQNSQSVLNPNESYIAEISHVISSEENG